MPVTEPAAKPTELTGGRARSVVSLENRLQSGSQESHPCGIELPKEHLELCRFFA